MSLTFYIKIMLNTLHFCIAAELLFFTLFHGSFLANLYISKLCGQITWNYLKFCRNDTCVSVVVYQLVQELSNKVDIQLDLYSLAQMDHPNDWVHVLHHRQVPMSV